ncbi:hypothetical protein ACKWTF_006396 [Chironomus riparius]
MPGIITLAFSLIESEIVEKLELSVNHQPEFDQLIIQSIPSTLKGLQLISQNWFESKVCSYEKLIAIILQIDDNLNDLPENIEFISKNRILVGFQSTLEDHESKSYWKFTGREKFYSLSIENDASTNATSFFREFIVDEIRNGRTGILEKYQHKNKIRLHEVGDRNEKNLLVLAVSKNQSNIVKTLLEHDFDADDAIDVAWELFEEINEDAEKKEEVNKIILCLLGANSRFPSDFEYEKASKEVQEFVDKCESLHYDVDDDNFDGIKEKLESNPDLIHFYERNSESLLAYSLRMKKFKIFEFLDKEITTGCHEDLDEVYENMIAKECRMLREQHKSNAIEFPETYIFILRSKSRIGNNDRHSNMKWKYIDEAFKTINSNDYCKKILKVAAEFKKLKIFFDFKHNSTYYLDPATSIYSKGIIYEGGSIFIGAKYLSDDDKKFEVFGVLAHELCHLALFLGFMNRNFDPFPVGQSNSKTRFIDQVMAQCKEQEESEKIIANVFKSYPQDVQDSEMIVTVPQMLMHYIRDPVKLLELEGIFEELFRYSREVVEPELDKALPVLKILGDDEKSIKFENLTEPMRIRILHSTINFQESETSFHELIGTDEKVLTILTSGNIRKILIKNGEMEFSSICELNLKYGLLERSFIERETSDRIKLLDQNLHLENMQKKKRTLESVQDLSIFLLSDHAGSGKTTIFKDIAIKLKALNKNVWVSFINLRINGPVLENFKNKIKDLTFDDVCQMLFEMVDQESDIEKAIFTKLFFNGTTILFFDGFDEISPKYTQIVMKMFEILITNEVKNHLWISTRPHCAEILEIMLNVKAFKFTDCTNEEYLEFITKILKLNKVPENSLKFEKVVQNVYYYIHNDIFLRPLVNEPSFVAKQAIENPLLIEMLTELFINDSIKVDTDNYNLYLKMVEKQKEKVGIKIPNLERDPTGKLSVWDVHKILSLLLIFGDDFVDELKFKLETLSIMKKWKKEKKNWTSDMIQRYGFVIVDLSADNLRSSIDFNHRTYAEFFIAQFLMDFIFDDNDEVSEAEVMKKFEIFDLVMKNGKRFSIILSFMVNFIKFGTYEDIGDEIKEILTTKIGSIHLMAENSEESSFDEIAAYFGNYSQFLINEDELLRNLWKLDGKNILQDFITKKYSLSNIADLAWFCFGPNWHVVMNKSASTLTTDEEFEQIKGDVKNENLWKNDKNSLKFCDLVDKNFDADVRKSFYENLRFHNIYTNEALASIILKMSSGCDRALFVSKCLMELNLFDIFSDNLNLVFTKIEEAYNNDFEEIRKFVFNNTRACGLLRVVMTTNIENFRIIRDFYIKYKKSWTEIQNILLSHGVYYFIYAPGSRCYYEFKDFVKEAFGNDTSRIANMIEQYNMENFHIPEASVDDLNDFLMYIFNNNEDKVKKLLLRINLYKL